MRITPALAADLALLTDTFDDSSDVAATLRSLMVDTAVAIPSYVGLVVRLTLVGQVAELSTLEFDHPREVVTSLRLRLGDQPPVDVVLFASVPGAFVDLAADLAWMTGRPDEFVLDEDRPPTAAVGLAALREQSTVNQAMGVLIGRGLTPVEAMDLLRESAVENDLDLHHAAAHVIDGLTPRPPAVRDHATDDLPTP